MKRLTFALAGLVGCATPAVVAPVASPVTAVALTPSQERCEIIMTVMCHHNEACTGRPVVECMAIATGVCADATGISSAEAHACAIDVADSTCDSGVPDRCHGIMDDDDAVQGEADVNGAVTL